MVKGEFPVGSATTVFETTAGAGPRSAQNRAGQPGAWSSAGQSVGGVGFGGVAGARHRRHEQWAARHEDQKSQVEDHHPDDSDRPEHPQGHNPHDDGVLRRITRCRPVRPGNNPPRPGSY